MKGMIKIALSCFLLAAFAACENKGPSNYDRDFSSANIGASTVVSAMSVTDVNALNAEITVGGFVSVPVVGDDDFQFLRTSSEKYETIVIDKDIYGGVEDFDYSVMTMDGYAFGKQYLLDQINVLCNLSGARLDDSSNIIVGTSSYTTFSGTADFYNKAESALSAAYENTASDITIYLEVDCSDGNDYKLDYNRTQSFDEILSISGED